MLSFQVTHSSLDFMAKCQGEEEIRYAQMGRRGTPHTNIAITIGNVFKRENTILNQFQSLK